MVSTPLVCRAFVGRTDELAHLLACRRAAGDAKGGLVLVGGEAGIGKSRLLAELAARTAHGTGRVVRVECRQFAQTPLGPLEDALRRLSADLRPVIEAASPEARFAALLDAFAAVAARRTTLVLVEDVHWADPELLGTLRALASRAATQRLLFVATYRNDQIVEGHRNFIPLGALLREPFVSLVALQRFESGPMIELLTQAAHDASEVPHALVRSVARVSEGNPLFGEELLRHAVDRRRLAHDDAPAVPLTIRAIVHERLERCSPRQKRLLSAAALCGHRFDVDLVATVLDDDGGVRVEELDALVDLQLLRSFSDQPGHFAFRHALTRDAISEERPPDEARALHRRIARALAARPDADAFVSEIAHHRWNAGDRDDAVASYEAAAQAARAQFAWDDAVRWYERAAHAAAACPLDVARVTLELGKVRVAANDEPRAFDAFGRVADIALAHADVALAVRARKLQAGIMANDGRREAAIALLERTLPLVRDALPAIATELLVRVASYRVMAQPESDEANPLDGIAEDAVGDDAPVAAEFYTVRATLRGRHGDEPGWRADFERALSIYRRRDAGMFERYLNAEFAMQAIARGDLRLARERLQRAREASMESASTRNDVPLGMAIVELHSGRIAAAAGWLNEVEPIAMLHSRMLHAFAAVSVAVARADDARVAALLYPPLLDELAARGEDFGFVRTAVAFAEGYAMLGRRAEADDLVERAARRLASAFDMLPAIASMASLRPDFTARLERLVEDRPRDAFRDGILALVQAEGFASTGAPERARDRAATARARLADLGWTLLAARAGEIGGDHAAAYELYREAGHASGMRRVAAVPPESRGVALGVLSARERELVEMIARGKSNRATAHALAISERTVEKHLTSIYAKLSVRSRAELIAALPSFASLP